MVNDLYHLIKAHDIPGIEELAAREPDCLELPVAYSNGIPVPITAILLAENNLELFQTFIKLGLGEFNNIESVSIELLIDFEPIQPEIILELLLLPGKKDPAKYMQCILRIFSFTNKYLRYD